MIDPEHALSITRQAELLELSRASVYYLPRATPASDLVLMRRLDELHLNHPFAGSRMLRDLLGLERFSVGRKPVASLMRKMGMEALYRRPGTSRRHAAHPTYPYLLRDRWIERPNQAWAMDITYIPMHRGFVLPGGGAGLGEPPRVAWSVSISMTTDFCIEAVERSAGAHTEARDLQTPIRGASSTSAEFTACSSKRHRHQHGWQGAWRDNVVRERSWKTNQIVLTKTRSDRHTD